MPGVFSESLNTTIKYLRRRDSGYLYAATVMLMTRADLFPCDKDGNLLGGSAIQAAGIAPIPSATPDKSLENIAKALGAPLDVVQKMAKGEVIVEAAEPVVAGISPDDVPADIVDVELTVSDLSDLEPAQEVSPAIEFDPDANYSTFNRADMVAWAKEKFGEPADTLDPEWSRKDLLGAIEMLDQGAAE